MPAREHRGQLRRHSTRALGQACDPSAQLKDPIQRFLILGAHGPEHPLCTDECVDGQQAEVGRRIDHYVLVGVKHRLERVTKEPAPAELTRASSIPASFRAAAITSTPCTPEPIAS